MTRVLEFLVTGDSQIHCASCEQRITRSLRQLKGVHDVDASAETQKVRVTMDPHVTTLEEVQKQLRNIGYEVAQGGKSRDS